MACSLSDLGEQALAVGFALAGALSYAVASVAQQQAAATMTSGRTFDVTLVMRLIRTRRWLIGLVAVIAGYLLQAVALDLGRLLVVEPVFPLGLLLALLPGPWLPIAAQSISGVSAAVFGVMLPLLAADITRGTSHFNLCIGALGLAVSLGAGLSTTLGGWIADTVGIRPAFASLALIGALATLVLWLAMPETRRE